MNTHYTYSLILASAVAGPLALSFDKKVAFYKKWKYLFPAMVVPALLYITWDIYFTSKGVWSFNEKYITGVKLVNLPIEEVLFFFIVPYCCVFIYECICCYFPGLKNRRVGDKVLQGLGIVLLVTGVFFYEKYYTGWTLIFCSVFIGMLYFGSNFFKDFDATYFLVSFAIIFLPFLIVNGFLTAIPIVVYDNEENLGIRIYTIPFEDIFYGMLLIMMDIAIYEKLRNGIKSLRDLLVKFFKLIIMEFGRVTVNELNAINFKLKADPAFNDKILTGKPLKNPKVYIGCAKWGRTEWLGKIYPPETKEKDFLEHYVQHYNSIELNATHYKIYGAEGIKKWADKAAKKDFLFCPKMYKGVTHFGSLKGKDAMTTEFLKGLLAFGKHLGPIFVQVGELFSPKRKQELFSYLESLPSDLQFFVEVRHPEWFANAKEANELFSKLRDLNIGAVITDTSGRRDCAHMYLTIPKVFIRYVGNSLDETDFTRIDDWVERIKYWLDNGLKEVYFFMHMHDETFSPELTVDLVDKLNKACGLNLQKPVFIAKQNKLFE